MTMNDNSRRKANRIAVVIAGSILIITGIISIITGQLQYTNYWGGLVFAPVAILAGILAIYIAIYRPSKMNLPNRDRKGRKISNPADEYRKW